MPIDSTLPTEPRYRVVSDFTDEETATQLLERMVQEAGIDRDRLQIVQEGVRGYAGP